MARKKKIVGFPDYLFKLSESYPGEADQMCLWLCSECGAPYHFRKKDGKHGRPTLVAGAGYSPFGMEGQPQYVGFIGPCWRSHEYSVKCATPKGGRILFHEGYDKPPPELVKEVARVAASQRKEQAKLDKARRAAMILTNDSSTT